MNQNVVVNILTLDGNKKEIKKLIKSIYSEKDGFNYNGFSEYSEEDKRMSYNDWLIYHWTLNSDILTCELISDNQIKFETLWVNPLIGIEYLSSQYPTIKFNVKYADEDIGYNVGEYGYLNGESIYLDRPEEGTVDAIIMSVKILDDEYYIYEYVNDLEEDEIQDGIDGIDMFISGILKCVYDKEILTDIYPKIVNQYLLSLAIENENYEYASELKKILN